jgi:hypothetical protein
MSDTSSTIATPIILHNTNHEAERGTILTKISNNKTPNSIAETKSPIISSITSDTEPISTDLSKRIVTPISKESTSPEESRLDLSDLSDLSDDDSKSMVDTTKPSKRSEDTKLHELHESEDLETDDSASVLVIILQCETRACDGNITNLKWIFSDPYFIVQVCAVDPPSTVSVSKTLTAAQYQENYFMRKTLTYAAEGPYISNSQGVLEPQFWWSKIPVIIVKDSSVSNITASGMASYSNNPDDYIIGGMKRRISIALKKAKQADLFFLCKWFDYCNKYTDVVDPNDPKNSINHGSMLKWSTHPTATQAIMYTPSSRNYIRNALLTTSVSLSDLLNNHIDSGKLIATVFVPNIIDFDVDLATSNEDYAKLNECAPVQSSSDTNTTSSVVWFIFIILIIFIVAWALMIVNPSTIN